MSIIIIINVWEYNNLHVVQQTSHVNVSIRTAKNRSFAVCHPFKMPFERLRLSVQRNTQPFERQRSPVRKKKCMHPFERVRELPLSKTVTFGLYFFYSQRFS